ncbi:Tat (twin-arginine translocation) pathway signal sequence [Catalinimonas alkaloidigena]|uniref:Tat (Twin-arginine translocation) pathway signal sequence n=2 Tax=Catalinimonas alkaloidigena TaxID=1075417 RepID=A0A1G9P8J0_9BACT|nr:Tat (twin-arginine translocation) pathway signal sequence [Catalinimonas alkaloidigena]
MSLSRRTFLTHTALATLAVAAGPAALTPARHLHATTPPVPLPPMPLSVFSKHLQWLDYDAMAEVAAEVGFDGVDLAVRPGGHVLPERVATDLPRAVRAVQKQGLQVVQITTAIARADDPLSRQVLATAAQLGIRYYRTDWLKYDQSTSISAQQARFERQLRTLTLLNREVGIRGSYQNHAGADYFGAPVWDLAQVLKNIRSEYLGCQYDIRHATLESAQSWPIGLGIIQPFVNTLVLKDAKWAEVKGRWQIVDTPIGEGRVDFPAFFRQLKASGLRVPVSIHFEYEMPEHNASLSATAKRQQTIQVMKKDLATLRSYLKQAGL